MALFETGKRAFRALFRGKKEEPSFPVFVDRIRYLKTEAQIEGWAHDPDAEGETFKLLDQGGAAIAVKIRRIARADVNVACGYPADICPGFILTVPLDALQHAPFSLEVRSRNAVVRVPLRLSANFEERIRYYEEDYNNPAVSPFEELLSYNDYARAHAMTAEQLQEQKEEFSRLAEQQNVPKISIVLPLYNTPENFLRALLQSIVNQTGGNWELCIADGSETDSLYTIIQEYEDGSDRIRYQSLSQNLGIAGNTNAAAALADGEYLAFVDHDDFLTEDALFEVTGAILGNPDAELLYSDEDKTDLKGDYFFDPFFKPAFDIELLRSYNYFTHLTVVSKKLFEEVGGLRAEFDGAQDYDLVLRCAEKAGKIVHIPRVLYHWRVHELSTAGNPESKQYAYENGRRAIESHLIRCGIPAYSEMTKYTGRYRCRYFPTRTHTVSVVLYGDRSDAMEALHHAEEQSGGLVQIAEVILEQSAYSASDGHKHLRLDDREQHERARAGTEGELSLEACERILHAKGEMLLFLRAGAVPGEQSFLAELCGLLEREDVVFAGTAIVKDGKYCNSGYIVEKEERIPIFEGLPVSAFQYAGIACLTHSVRAASLACLLVRTEDYRKADGFDRSLPFAEMGTDLCLSLTGDGRHGVVHPFSAVMLPGDDVVPERIRFSESMKQKWNAVLSIPDPIRNPNMEQTRGDFVLTGQYRPFSAE